MTAGDDSPPIDALLSETAWIRALARSLVVDQATADDVAQDATVIALTKPPSSAAALRGWLRRVVKNLASNARRGETRRGAREKSVAVHEADVAADEVVARWELRRQVVEAVLSLAEPYRSTILLRFFDGLTAADAAARLGVPLETVRTRTRRGLEILRTRLARLDDGEGRRGVAVLLLLARRESDVAGTALGASSLAGGVVMASGTKWIGVAAIALVASWMTWAVVTTSAPPKPNESATALPPSAPPRNRRAPPSTNAAAPTLPDAVDLATCDRERDLFGEVVASDGRPVAGAAVRVMRTKPLGTLIATHGFLDPFVAGEATRSGFDGTFSLRLAPREAVTLRVEAAGFARWESWNRQAGERVRVTLAPEMTLTVTVKSHDGDPVSGAHVCVSADLDRTDGPGAMTFARQVGSTNPHGAVRFANVSRSSKACVSVSPAAHASAFERVAIADAAEQTVEIVLPAGRELRGSVVDGSTRAGLAGAAVTMNGASEPAAITGVDGRFVVADAPLDSGTSLGASASGHASAGVRVRATDTDVTIALGASCRIVGRVVRPDGQPVAGADVAATATLDSVGGDRSHAGASTGDDGRFVLDGLVPGVWHTVRVHGAGWATLVRSITTSAADPWTTDAGEIRLAPPRTLRGVVVDREDKPVVRVDVTLASAGSGVDDLLREHRYTDDLGRFAFADLPAGKFRLEARDETPSAEREVVSFDVPESRDPWPVTIHLGGDPAVVKTRIPVTTRVTDDAGNPVEGVQLQLGYIANGATAAQHSGADGAAAFSAEFEPSHVSVYLDREQSKTYLPVWVPLRPGQRDIAVTLRRGRTISGKVVDEDGEPVKGGSVEAWTGAARAGWGATDNDGRFAFAVAAGSKVDLTATPQDEPRVLSRSAGELRGVGPGAEDLVIRVIRDPAPRTIDVQVVDEAGAPVVQAMVLTKFHGQDQQHPSMGTTGADGRCRIESLPRAPLLVSATIYDRAAGYDRYWTPQPVRVAAGEDSVKIVVAKPRAISGRVVAEDGSPVAGAVVHASPNAALQGCMNIAGPDGRFTILVPPDALLPFTVSGNPLPLDPAKPMSGWDLVDADDRELTIVLHAVPSR